MKQSIVIPYYKNKQELLFMLKLLKNTIPEDVEVIIVANNSDSRETDISFENYTVLKYPCALLYSKAANIGVEHASGEIITLLDQDIFVTKDWYAPLLNKLLSNNNVGAVSSKMLNLTNNRILEYGIEYTSYNSAHIGKDLLHTSEVTQNDICVSSACGGVLMTYKSLYTKLKGMDEDMPYICCDCDYTLKLWELGKEVWIAANSVVYHKSFTSKNTGKISDYRYLEHDSRWKFYQKNSNRMRYNLGEWMDITFEHFLVSHTLLKNYVLINLSSYHNVDWYKTFIKEKLHINFYDVYTFSVKERNCLSIQLYDYVPYDFVSLKTPLIYFVDSFLSLQNNAFWFNMRNIKNDIIVDINGAICSVEDLIKGIY